MRLFALAALISACGSQPDPLASACLIPPQCQPLLLYPREDGEAWTVTCPADTVARVKPGDGGWRIFCVSGRERLPSEGP